MLVTAAFLLFQSTFSQSDTPPISPDSIVTIYSIDNGKEMAMGSGFVVGADGFVLTALHLVKNTGQISVRLSNGEIFDNAKIVNRDDRRNVAILKIGTTGLKAIPQRTLTETPIGGAVYVVSNSNGGNFSNKRATLSGSSLANEVAGAGTGYKLFLFDPMSSENLAGSLLIDQTGYSIGVVTTNPNVKQQNIAIPFTTIVGLMSLSGLDNTTAEQTKSADDAAKPVVESIAAPAIMTAKVEAQKPGTKPTAYSVLHSAKTIYVHSSTAWIKDPAFIAELMNNMDFKEWGWSFTNDRSQADLILEVSRVPWVIKFAFKVYSLKQGVIIAAGNVHTNDMNFGSPDLVHAIITKIKVEWSTVR